MTQALNLHDVGFVLWWLAFAALTNVGDDPNATVFLEVLVKRAAYASEAVFPGLAQADAALRDILSPHAEDWYKPHGLGVYAAVMAQQVRDARACYRPRRWLVRARPALRANANVLDGVCVARCIVAQYQRNTRIIHATRLRTTSPAFARASTHTQVCLPLAPVLLRAHLTPGARRYSLSTAPKPHPRTTTHAQSRRICKTDTQQERAHVWV